MKTKYQYLFGPVPSRRFGRSLGVDLTPYKVCSQDCVFCQLGQTTDKTIDRNEYVPIDTVLAELKHWLASGDQADYITLSGSGEPTLHARFGEILEFVRMNTDIPSVLLTNGSMLYLPEVAVAAAAADVVKLSLCAWNQSSFEWVNRPAPQLQFDQLVKGQKAFRAQFNGRLWMEVFLIAGMNSLPKDVQKIAALAKEIAPDRIQLNTAVRPPAENFVLPLSREQLSTLTDLFEPKAEIIAEFSKFSSSRQQANQDTILAMLQRRPCTAKQISDAFGMHLNEALKYLGKLMRTDQIHVKSKNTEFYYIGGKQ
jgi:wyosine [tRNA(Phe)-imidazoG37] synthetase (radical SAM superfamily)